MKHAGHNFYSVCQLCKESIAFHVFHLVHSQCLPDGIHHVGPGTGPTVIIEVAFHIVMLKVLWQDGLMVYQSGDHYE